MLDSQSNAGRQLNLQVILIFFKLNFLSLFSNLGAWEQYSENYCFVQNTYFLPLTHYIPQDIAQREEREIGK